MKKLITLVALCLIAVLAASPFIIGSKIESISHEQATIAQQELTQAAKTNPYFQTAHFKLADYEKGYRHSTARSLLSIELYLPLGSADNAGTLINIPLHSEITHGPYLGNGHFGLAKIISRPDLSKTDSTLPDFIKADTFTAESIISFNGTTRNKAMLKPIRIQYEDGIEMVFQGMTANLNNHLNTPLTIEGTFNVSHIEISDKNTTDFFQLTPFEVALKHSGDAQTASGNYQLKTSAISGDSQDGLSFTLEKITSQGQYQPIAAASFSASTQETVLTRLQITDPASFPSPITFPEFHFQSQVEQNTPETVNVNAQYRAQLEPGLADALQLPVEIQTIDIDVKLSSLSIQAWQTYTALLQTIDATAAAESESDQIATQTQIQDQVVNITQSALQHNATAVIKLRAETAQGNANATVDLQLVNNPDLNKADLQNLLSQAANQGPVALLPLLAGIGHVHLDKSILDQTGLTPMIQAMAGSLITLENNVFKSELLIEDGQVLINKQPLPLFAVPPTQNN